MHRVLRRFRFVESSSPPTVCYCLLLSVTACGYRFRFVESSSARLAAAVTNLLSEPPEGAAPASSSAAACSAAAAAAATPTAAGCDATEAHVSAGEDGTALRHVSSNASTAASTAASVPAAPPAEAHQYRVGGPSRTPHTVH